LEDARRLRSALIARHFAVLAVAVDPDRRTDQSRRRWIRSGLARDRADDQARLANGRDCGFALSLGLLVGAARDATHRQRVVAAPD
jgi:hypothetical protein